MHKQWQAVEEESSRLITLINQGTDRNLLHALDSMSPEQLRSAVTHIAKEGGNTVLHLAAVRERLDSIKAMLRNHVDINARDGNGNSPLYSCLCHNSLSSARLLINYGADVNELVSRATKETLLHRMIKGDRTNAVDLLIDASASVEAITKDGDTPLHYAARYNRAKMARLLVQVGAEINAVNTKQETPLHVAIKNRSMDVAKVLVKNRASVTAKDRHGMTALHSAVAASAVELVRLMLINNSTQVNSKEALLGRTPLLLACSKSNQNMATLLLSHGADANLTTNYRKSVLHVAACSGKPKVLSAVLKHVTNRNALALNNKTPLHCAVLEGQSEIVKILLKSGVNVNLKDIDGNTALHMASQTGNNNIIKDLLQHGVYVNATNMEQQTPLHVAFMMGHEETGWILLQAGCDADLMDIHESTAQDYLDEFHRRAQERAETETENGAIGRVRFSGLTHDYLQDIAEENSSEEEKSQSDSEERLDHNGDGYEREPESTKMQLRNEDATLADSSDEAVSLLGQVLQEMILTNGLTNGGGDDGEDDDGNKANAVDLGAEDNEKEQSSDGSDDEEDTHQDLTTEGGAEGGRRKRSKHRKSSKGRTSRNSPVRRHSKSKPKHKTSKGENDSSQHCEAERIMSADHIKCQRRRKTGLAALK